MWHIYSGLRLAVLVAYVYKGALACVDFLVSLHALGSRYLHAHPWLNFPALLHATVDSFDNRIVP